MFYRLLKFYARLAIRIYCKRIIINESSWLQSDGPLLLACNHPNSFLDGMIITTLFKAPVRSLARGDAFKKPFVNRLLKKLQLLPVYRTSEGVENLPHNYATFNACRETFQQQGIVLIFSEGRCENEWHLRPLRKGTARLALTSWETGIPLKVIPTALNYSSFRRFGKEVHLNFGKPIIKDLVLEQETEGKRLLEFNRQLHESLKDMVYEVDPGDHRTIRRLFDIRIKSSLVFLLLPALGGWLVHAPVFYSCKLLSSKAYHSGHYDSILTSLLLLAYPFYLLFLVIGGSFFIGWWTVLLLLLPVTAWCTVQVKYQLDL